MLFTRLTAIDQLELIATLGGEFSGCEFGNSLVSMDFNGDGLCDLAISAPWYFEGQPTLTSGKVFIYSGNIQLQDSAVGVEDEVIPAVQSEEWNLNIYPNPVQHGRLGISIIKSENSLPSPDNFCIYNMKGQLVMKSELRDTDWQKGVVELIVPDLPNGVYLVRLSNQQGKSSTQKVMIAK